MREFGRIGAPPGFANQRYSIIPTTVPKRPSSGAIAAHGAEHRQEALELVCCDPPRLPSMASFITGRGLLARWRAPPRVPGTRGPCAAVLDDQLGVNPSRLIFR